MILHHPLYKCQNISLIIGHWIAKNASRLKENSATIMISEIHYRQLGHTINIMVSAASQTAKIMYVSLMLGTR